jgi:hypothetical protein
MRGPVDERERVTGALRPRLDDATLSRGALDDRSALGVF